MKELRNYYKTNNQNNKLAVFSVAYIIITSGSVLFSNKDNVRYILLLDILIIIAQFFLVRKKLLSKYKKNCMLIFSMGILVLLSMLGNLDFSSFLTYARLLVIITLAFGTSLLVENEVIIATFVKTVIILASISVIFYYSGIIEGISSSLPVILFNEHTYVNAFIYISLNGLELRNTSIFIEPGLYQIYLNIALFILLNTKKKYNYKYIAVIILLFTIYSTKSTTGYILSLLIISGQAFTSTLHTKNIAYNALKMVAVIAVLYISLTSEIFSSNMEEKFSGSQIKSSEARENASIVDYLLITKNPIIGCGFGSYERLFFSYESDDTFIDASPNTFSQLGANIGTPFIFLILWRIMIYISRLKIDFVGKLILLAIYIISFSTEPFVLYPLFYLPVFMSYRKKLSL